MSVTACGSDTEEPPAAAPAPPEAPERASSRHYGYIRSVEPSASPVTIRFDEAEFLTGEEANRAAVEDGVIAPGEPVPNDYYVRNPDEQARVLELGPDATVTAVRCPTSCTQGTPGDLDDFLASFEESSPSLAADYRGASSQYWLTIEDGVVVAIDEQYIP